MIGTSGWQYRRWRGDFYPADLPAKHWLRFTAENFNSVEVNSSFYRMPKPEYLRTWGEIARQANPDFLFSLKLYMWFTRFKRLRLAAEDLRILQDFLKNSKQLGKSLGPILIQLPPGLKCSLEILEKFCKQLKTCARKLGGKFLFAIEFRRKSWLVPEVYAILKKYKIAFVISDSPRWPTDIVRTADFVYVRFHGQPQLFASPYAKTDLEHWAEKILALKPKTIFAYFNNDALGHAPFDAKKFRAALKPASARSKTK